jgi:catechol 2,3-dioxygenase-like lactoylglutathione lyase family enzyme
MSGGSVPPLRGVLETVVYSDDLERARAFYAETLRLDCILDSARMLAFAVAPAQVLLVFRRGATAGDSETPGGVVPGHGSEGPSHFAFAIDAADYDPWKQHLREEGVAITSEVTWPKGGRSIYFDDPDGNVVELATPGLWTNY